MDTVRKIINFFRRDNYHYSLKLSVPRSTVARINSSMKLAEMPDHVTWAKQAFQLFEYAVRERFGKNGKVFLVTEYPDGRTDRHEVFME